MSRQLICAGFDYENVVIPKFKVSSNEFALVSNSLDFEQLYQLMQLIARNKSPAIKAFGKVSVVYPFKNVARFSIFPISSKKHIVKAGLSNEIAHAILHKIGVEPDRHYLSLPGTPRCMLDLLIAQHQNADLVLLSTGGLDPCGIQDVTNVISENLHQCAAIDFIHSSLIDYYKSHNNNRKIIRCEEQ